MSTARKIAICLLAAAGLAACQTVVPYHPREAPGATGYYDQQLTETRYRVTFTGNSATPRDAVEDYLLRRAAEVTENAGRHYFLFDVRDTDVRTRYRGASGRWPGGWCCRRGPFWPGWDGPGTDDFSPVSRYEAYAEIVLLTDEEAKNNPHAVDAREILKRQGGGPEKR